MNLNNSNSFDNNNNQSSNNIDDTWLLGETSSNNLSLSLQNLHQQQQQIYDTFDFQNINFNLTPPPPSPPPPTPPIHYNSNISENLNNNNFNDNARVREQLLLIHQQQQQQQEQFQLHLQNYQLQQELSFQQRQQQFLNFQQTLIPNDNIQIQQANNNNANAFDPIIIDPLFATPSPILSPTTTTTTTSVDTQLQPINTTTNNNNTSPTTTTSNKSNKSNKSKKSKSTTKEEDLTKKQLFYHKKHREKKKDYVKDIEDQITALTFENQQIIKENENLKKFGLGVENMLPESIIPYTEIMKISLKMREALETNDERSLIYLLHQYHITFARMNTFCGNDAIKVLHPNVQLLTTFLSYIPHTDPKSFDIIAGPGSNVWVDQFKIQAELTKDQCRKLDDLRAHFRKVEDQSLKERLELDIEIKRMFGTYMMFLPSNPLQFFDVDQPYPSSDISKTPISQRPMDLSQCLEFVCKLDELRRKVYFGRIFYLDIISSLCKILTPRQEAMYFVRVDHLLEIDFSNFSILNHVWKGLMSNSSVSDIADSLEHMLNGNNNFNNNTSNINVKLQPATFLL